MPSGGETTISAGSARPSAVRTNGVGCPALAPSASPVSRSTQATTAVANAPGSSSEREPIQLIEGAAGIAAVEQVGAQGVTQLGHRARGGDSVPRNVAERDRQLAVRQRERVVPVAADPPPGGRLVMRRERPAGDAGQAGRKQAALQHLGRPQIALRADVERLDEMLAQGGAELALVDRPRLGSVLDLLAPALERLARTQPDAVRPPGPRWPCCAGRRPSRPCAAPRRGTTTPTAGRAAAGPARPAAEPGTGSSGASMIKESVKYSSSC